MNSYFKLRKPKEPWNKGKLVGQKLPLKLKEIWAIRIRLQLSENQRELALFNLAVDSKLRGCDLVKLRVRDIAQAGRISKRAIITQQKTNHPVRFEITGQSRESLTRWIASMGLMTSDFLFPSRIRTSPHISARQYSRIVDSWVNSIGLESANCGTHTNAAYKSIAYLSENQKFESSATATWTHKAGKYSPILGNRSG